MNCCDFSQVITHNDNSSKLTNTLKFYTFLYLGFSILKLFVMKGGDFFSEILIFFLLLLTINQCYFYTAIFALFFVLFQLFIESFTLLLIIQDYVFNLAQINMLIAIIELLSVILYFLIVSCTFKAYREYKALYFEQGGNGRMYNRINDGGNDIELQNQSDNQNENGKKKFVPFSGKGATWG